jgi:hypothetical protein
MLRGEGSFLATIGIVNQFVARENRNDVNNSRFEIQWKRHDPKEAKLFADDQRGRLDSMEFSQTAGNWIKDRMNKFMYVIFDFNIDSMIQ